MIVGLLVLLGVILTTVYVANIAEAAIPPSTIPQGGTGWGAFQNGSIPYGNPSSVLRFATTTQGTAGFVLMWSNGIPTWAATSTAGDGVGTWFTPDSNYGALTMSTGTPVWFKVGFQASSTSQIAFASTTAISSVTASTTDLYVSSILNGIHYGNSLGKTLGTTTVSANFGGTGQNSNAWTGLTLTTAGVWSQYAGTGACGAGTAVTALSASGVATCTAFNSNIFTFPFTSTLNFGALANSTTTPIWFTKGIMASSTSYMQTAFHASTTAPQLFLDDMTSALWSLRSIAGNLFFATSTQANPNATSTLPAVTVTSGGQLYTGEDHPATSTTMFVDWATTKNQVNLQILASAMTIGFNNASTSGMTKRIVVCNGGTTASTVTWSIVGLLWGAGTAPTQTTTANKCDIYSFIVTQATSTANSTVKILGAQTANF